MRDQLPNKRACLNVKEKFFGNRNVYVSLGRAEPDGPIKEVFISTHKTGEELQLLHMVVGQLISIGLQHGVSPRVFISLLIETKSQFRSENYTSVLDMIARLLLEHHPEFEEAIQEELKKRKKPI